VGIPWALNSRSKSVVDFREGGRRFDLLKFLGGGKHLVHLFE